MGHTLEEEVHSRINMVHIVMTGGSSAKADKAVEELAKLTGKDKTFFSYVLMDCDDLQSVKTAVDAFPDDFDRLMLNAGGFGNGKIHEASGATQAQVINTLGHAVLVDGLLDKGKIKDGAWVVYVGSEVSRSLISFTGLLPNYCGNFPESRIDRAISTKYKSCYCCHYGCCIPPGPLRSQ